ncbi:gliding motility-associated peptidyl-prolyl isomerase GldI [Croceivirga thetidis]|uniref:Peptidyl-prolyl cis-trans isomerase n=1 Tax=Croceivirga thetidis TaxID=2721623 RepID=A0ABX1GSB4_9FLAO|nr:gliding motility-associated peptidyl-prolyl isomerase GldI [Croceivirga thetidis]NKI32833.1 gliding motility-associated peptidyl-prolyl isomerase GldI [Croceivirga thetidis]
MTRKLVVFFLCMVFISSCNESLPRRPIQNKSGSFYKESIERSRRILSLEEKRIKLIIEEDTVHDYLESANGFWYFYENHADSMIPQASTDDEVILKYNIMELDGDTIYRSDVLGMQQIKVDKTQLFPGLRNAIKLLKEGEKATFFFPSSQAFGYKGDNNKIGANVPVRSSLELLKILKPIDSLTR